MSASAAGAAGTSDPHASAEQLVWKMIDSYFRDNPQALVNHHVESYNDFFQKGIFQIFREKNPLKWMHASQYDEGLGDYRTQCTMYMGGRDGSKIYFGKPVLYDQNEPHFMFPNEARLRNITYAMTVHYDIEIEFLNILPVDSVEEAVRGDFSGGGGEADEEDEALAEETSQHGGAPPKKKAAKTADVAAARGPPNITPSDAKTIREYIASTIDKDPQTGRIVQKRILKLEKVYLGKFPIMVQSNFCVLHGASKEARYTMGECRNDPGGYFIVDGKEKVVIPQEKFADNMLYIRRGGADQDYLYSAEIRSVSENVTKPVRTLSVRLMAPGKKYTYGNIVVNIPNVRKPVPLFILFRALGVLSDRDIISTILLDMDKYASLVDVFIPSVHDAGLIYTQRNAIEHLGYLTKGKNYYHGLEILADYFLPHVGETNYLEKAYYLGHMVFRMLSVHAGWELPTDRDHFKYKRMELVGNLVHELFREYYTLQLKRIHLKFETELNMNEGNYAANLPRLIQDNERTIFREEGRIVEDGFRRAFKGNWGAHAHTKRIGVIQDLNRLSFNTMISHLRKTNLPIDAGLKIVGPRLLHNSQWGFIDPVDTPDGGNIGIHKNLAIVTAVSRGYSREPMIAWLREMVGMRFVTDHVPFELAQATKVMVNGFWAGCVTDPLGAVQKIRTYRRNAMIPLHTSVTFDYRLNQLSIYTDSGRLCRPIFYTDEGGKLSIERTDVQKHLAAPHISWDGLVRGWNPRLSKVDVTADQLFTRLHELYQGVGESLEQTPAKLTAFLKEQAVIDYIDSSETENAYIAMDMTTFHDAVKAGQRSSAGSYTHCEIHSSLLLGVMGNQVTFPEMNQFPRDLFSCGQSKQATSLYHSNYQMRMDKSAAVLHYGQVPLVKTRYLDYIHREEHPYGFNAIVAIACYTGYNVEDAILINEGALARGMFRTTMYTSYSAHEERGDATDGSVPIDKVFTQIEGVAETVVGMKPGYDYSQLDAAGLVREGTPVNEKTILIGMTAVQQNAAATAVALQRGDLSVKPKKGQLGYVDKTYMTEGEEGERVAKVRVREERIPAMGDKFAGRAGQKGTIGMVIPEADMPFTKDGIRPDIIINPHAIPSRMTIGQLVESVTGKACCIYGGFADCTAFGQKGAKVEHFGVMLQKQDDPTDAAYESYGNEILYNGMTGEQIESSIFLGTVYYMRLKHMVKDKQQSRCLGPRSALTKQPVGGRANDGGLRIGEMERDSILAHGAAGFLNESMMERSDKYYVAVCNQTGMLAIYNPTKNLFMSPMTDGPLKFLNEHVRDGSQLRLETVTRFGRNFSVVEIPYTMKLLIQELQTINIQMRIITEDNIDQLESMSYARIPDPVAFAKQVEKVAQAAEAHQDLHKKVHDILHQEMTPSPSQEPVSDPSVEDHDTPHYRGVDDYTPSPRDASGSDLSQGLALDTSGSAAVKPQPLLGSAVTAAVAGEEDIWKMRSQPPATGPTSSAPPRQLHPEVSELTPNQASTVTTYTKRQFVHLQGDTKPDRLWFIHDMVLTKNNAVIFTLMTNDYEGLREQDQIQVVKESRLIPVAAAAPSVAAMTGGGRIPWGKGGQESGGGEDTGKIIFAPVLVNGNGNTMGPDMGSAPMMGGMDWNMEGGGAGAPMPPPLPVQHLGGNYGHGDRMGEGSKPRPAAKKETETTTDEGGTWFSKALDFGKKILVSKTG